MTETKNIAFFLLHFIPIKKSNRYELMFRKDLALVGVFTEWITAAELSMQSISKIESLLQKKMKSTENVQKAEEFTWLQPMNLIRHQDEATPVA